MHDAPPLRFLAISGSLRAGSVNTAVLRAARELTPEGVTLELYDLGGLPLYDDDLRRGGFPEPVARLRRALERADAVVLASPEYNHSFTGVLKNALDWASRPPEPPLRGKPVAVLGAATGGFGTVRSQLHLRQVLRALDAHALNRPEVHVSHAADKLGADGRLVDEATRTAVRELLGALEAWTRRLRPAEAAATA